MIQAAYPQARQMSRIRLIIRFFIPPDQVEAEWTRLGKEKEWEKLQQAVRESRDAVMTYQGRAITASFSTSNGYTENAEDVWERCPLSQKCR